MSIVRTVLTNLWENFTSVLSTFGLLDALDVLLVAYIIYHAIRLVRETRAMQLVKGIAAIMVLFFVADLANMITLSFLIRNILQVGLFALVVLFQPELRRALEQMGRSKLGGFGRLSLSYTDEEVFQKIADLIGIIGDSVQHLSERETGALLVLEREIKLGEIIRSGTLIDSEPSMELITNLFFKNSPLHDGALIIRDCRLCAAGCFLPLSGNSEIGRDLGTRHRAALGMSEISDAVVVVVSEETGSIAVAVDSRLQRGLSPQNLRKLLTAKLLPAKGDESASAKKPGFWRRRK